MEDALTIILAYLGYKFLNSVYGAVNQRITKNQFLPLRLSYYEIYMYVIVLCVSNSRAVYLY